VTQDPILRVAAKALILDGDGRLLVLRESRIATNSQAGLYGCVGGGLLAGEEFYAALRRETKEETGLSIYPVKPVYVGEWRPNILGTQYHIVATFVWCHTDTTEVELSPEHDHFLWIRPEEYPDLPMMQPDTQAIDQLIKELRHS
jgi:8-oxo-dGTP pyrophosphatase MutT (NUDIX family)